MLKCLLQSEAGGERSTSESSSDGVWQGEVLLMFDNCTRLVNKFLCKVLNSLNFISADTARRESHHRKSRDKRTAG